MKPPDERDDAAAGATAPGESAQQGNLDHIPPLPLYAVCDRRESDGMLRILQEYRDVSEALAAAELMRWAGCPARVVLVTSIRNEVVSDG